MGREFQSCTDLREKEFEYREVVWKGVLNVKVEEDLMEQSSQIKRLFGWQLPFRNFLRNLNVFSTSAFIIPRVDLVVLKNLRQGKVW